MAIFSPGSPLGAPQGNAPYGGAPDLAGPGAPNPLAIALAQGAQQGPQVGGGAPFGDVSDVAGGMGKIGGGDMDGGLGGMNATAQAPSSSPFAAPVSAPPAPIQVAPPPGQLPMPTATPAPFSLPSPNPGMLPQPFSPAPIGLPGRGWDNDQNSRPYGHRPFGFGGFR